jgi:hypothetical protein
MAINTCIAFFYREFKMQGVDIEAYNIWLVCVPIVVVGAPMGAILSSHFHRAVFAMLIYIVDISQFVGALVIIKPWLSKAEGGKTDKPDELCGTSAAILISGAIYFTWMAFAGQYLEKKHVAEAALENKKMNISGSSKNNTHVELAPVGKFELTSSSFDDKDDSATCFFSKY